MWLGEDRSKVRTSRSFLQLDFFVWTIYIRTFSWRRKKSRKKVDQVVEPLPKGFHFWLHVVLLPHEDLDELLGHRPQVSDLRPPLFDLAAESSLLRLPRLEELGLGRVDPLRHFLERVPEFFQQRSVL